MFYESCHVDAIMRTINYQDLIYGTINFYFEVKIFFNQDFYFTEIKICYLEVKICYLEVKICNLEVKI
eukprot:g57095.t1